MIKPEDIIKSIRESFHGSTCVFSYGSCYQLYKILKQTFPFAEPLINESGQHIVTRIGYSLYDIKGKVSREDCLKEKFKPLTQEQINYYEDRKFDIENPSMFIPWWFVEEEVYCHEFMERLAEHMGYKIVKEDFDND